MSAGIRETGVAVANRLLMTERLKENLVWVFVEGVDDKVGFNKCFKSGDVIVETAYCKQHVIDALDHYIANASSDKLVIGIVDRDHDFLLDQALEKEFLFYTDHHDFLVTAFLSRSLEDVLVQNSITDDIEVLRTRILQKTAMPGIVRLINEKHNLRLNLRLYASSFSSLSSKEAAKKLLSEQMKKKAVTINLEDEIDKEVAVGYPEEHLCQGHDVCRVFHSEYNKCKGNIEHSLMCSYGPTDFSDTTLFKAIHGLFASRSLEACLVA